MSIIKTMEHKFVILPESKNQEPKIVNAKEIKLLGSMSSGPGGYSFALVCYSIDSIVFKYDDFRGAEKAWNFIAQQLMENSEFEPAPNDVNDFK